MNRNPFQLVAAYILLHIIISVVMVSRSGTGGADVETAVVASYYLMIGIPAIMIVSCLICWKWCLRRPRISVLIIMAAVVVLLKLLLFPTNNGGVAPWD
jgi:cell division protein FtsW (lipid II flippase)